MPVWKPVTQIMPVASMVTGAVVSSALCDQFDDNIAALYEGVWFRARRSTTQALVPSVATLLILDTISMSDTAVDTGCISIVNGQVQTTLTGHWRIGGHYSTGATGVFLSVLVDATDAPSAYACETVCDTGSNKTDVCATGTANVTSAVNLFSLYGFAVGSPVVDADQKSPVLWGVYRGDV